MGQSACTPCQRVSAGPAQSGRPDSARHVRRRRPPLQRAGPCQRLPAHHPGRRCRGCAGRSAVCPQGRAHGVWCVRAQAAGVPSYRSHSGTPSTRRSRVPDAAGQAGLSGHPLAELEPSGEFDMDSIGSLPCALSDAYGDGATCLQLDISAPTFGDSSFLNALIHARSGTARLVLVGPVPDRLRHLFDLTGATLFHFAG
ncbi:STAS domain-containing protein [Streptomyces sp. NPDC055055]